MSINPTANLPEFKPVGPVEEQLLRDIEANPDQPSYKLILADWLTDYQHVLNERYHYLHRGLVWCAGNGRHPSNRAYRFPNNYVWGGHHSNFLMKVDSQGGVEEVLMDVDKHSWTIPVEMYLSLSPLTNYVYSYTGNRRKSELKKLDWSLRAAFFRIGWVLDNYPGKWDGWKPKEL